MDRNLIVIAGYPKSGSTWLRFVLEFVIRGFPKSFAIHDMTPGFYGAWRRILFDEFSPVNAADLVAEEIEDMLPGVFRSLSETAPGPQLVKSHDVLSRTRSGQWLFPPECIRAVFYLVRHPFDVAVSYAHHLALPVSDAVAIMARDSTVAGESRSLRLTLHEHIGSWSANIQSWLGDVPYPVQAIRYEDLHRDPVSTFSEVFAALELRLSATSVAAAVAAASFERMRNEEMRSGFQERPRTSREFFRAGRPRSWEGELDDSSRARLLADHAAVMADMGYNGDGGAIFAPALAHRADVTRSQNPEKDSTSL